MIPTIIVVIAVIYLIFIGWESGVPIYEGAPLPPERPKKKQVSLELLIRERKLYREALRKAVFESPEYNSLLKTIHDLDAKIRNLELSLKRPTFPESRVEKSLGSFFYANASKTIWRIAKGLALWISIVCLVQRVACDQLTEIQVMKLIPNTVFMEFKKC